MEHAFGGELHQIQTHLRLQERQLPNMLEAFLRVLKMLGCESDTTTQLIQGFQWDSTTHDFVYMRGDSEWGVLHHNGHTVQMRPHIMGWTPKGWAALSDNWIELGLIFRTDDLLEMPEYPHVRYRSGVESLLWWAMLKCATLENNYGVFLTNEAQDEQPWEGLIERSGKRWNCDAAILSHNVSQLYGPVPETFHSVETSNGIGIARHNMWIQLPWSV